MENRREDDMSNGIRSLGRAVAIGAALSIGAAGAWAQNYPSQAITLVVPFGAGGSVDRMARMLADRLTEDLGQRVVVENMPGASSNLGSNRVAQAEPDGYTLLITSAALAVNYSLFNNMPFDAKTDFTPIVMVGEAQNILVTNPMTGVTTVQEMIDYVRARPGAFTYASTGSGTSGHLSFELLKFMAGLEIEHAPYSNVGQAHTDLIANIIPFQMPTIPAVLGHLEAGTMVALAVSGSNRIGALPDLPTMHEAGVEGYAAVTWYPIVGPAGLPDVVVTTIHEAVKALLEDEAFVEDMRAATIEPNYMGPDELRAFVIDEIAKWAGVIEEAGIERQ